jgi:hypothetical protein
VRRAAESISGWALRRRVAAAAAVPFAASIVAPVAEATPASTSQRIRELLERPDGLRIDGQSLDPRALERFYRPRDFAPAWDAHDGGLDRTALLLWALATADAHGLDPGRYHLDAIRARQWSSNGGQTAELDLLLTASAAPSPAVPSPRSRRSHPRSV